MTTAIEFQHVQKDFNGQTVIPDLNLMVDQGELFVLVGTSGSGKTTSLKMINRLEPLTAGKILVNGADTTTVPVRDLRWQMGYVLQQIALFPTMTVAQNIAVISEMKGTAKKTINQTIDELLTEVGLDPQEYRDRMPSELSGGEQQRVALGRALYSKPTILLLDEPLSALDWNLRKQVRVDLVSIIREWDVPCVWVTHDESEADAVGDRHWNCEDGQIIIPE